MSRKRWMLSVVTEANKAGKSPSQVLPFTRQAKSEQAAKPAIVLQKRARA
ncbi:MAG: hypothetical protein AAGI10_05975 [Pseudomonadota bacterium]